ncbi:MAG: hypothetical protein LC803_01420 [Acidobacteria bacterium]|nr:hypothetical protein [Acidobacteriota bacterium]
MASAERIQTEDDKEKERAVRSLERVREKYSALRSVHLAADVKMTVYGKDFRAGSGTYEYWAEGDRYRIKSRTDKHLGLKTDFDVAYDGKRYYLLDARLKVLSYQQKDVTRTFTALPNPLFLPVDYLSNDDDDCALCALRLPDFKIKDARSSERVKSLAVKSERRDDATGGIVSEVEMPGGKTNKRAFRLILRTLEANEGHVRPLQINRVGTNDKILNSLSFANFTPTVLGVFPRTMSIKAFDDEGNLAVQAEFIVRTLELNEPIENSIFTIGFGEAEAVWDSDGKIFVKEKSVNPPRAQSQ